MKRLSPSTAFDSSELQDDIAFKAVTGGMTTLTSQIVLFALRILSMAILARLLSPGDFGLIGMSTVVIVFAELFKDAGLSLATVQKQRISNEQVSTLFWINSLIGALLTFCILACAPLVAWFFGKPQLLPVTAALSLTFIISGMTIQHQALQRRHMRFGTLACIQILAQLIAVAATIVLALVGWRYWALVAGTLVGTLASGLLTFAFFPWIPGRTKRGSGVRKMLRFGGHVTGFNFINYFARNADNILIGKSIGAEALGYYGRAYQLLLLPITMMSGPLGSVAVPTLSRLNNDRERLHNYYLKALYLLSLCSSPMVGIAFIASDEIILILLGPAWTPVSAAFRYLAIGGLLQPIYNTQSWLHLAAGRADRVFTWGLIGTPIIVGSFFIGLGRGINGVAFCYSMAIIVTTAGSLAFAGRSVELPFSRMVRTVSHPLLSCIAAVMTANGLASFVPLDSPLTSLGVKAALFATIYYVVLLVLRKGDSPFRDLLVIWRIVTRHGEEKK